MRFFSCRAFSCRAFSCGGCDAFRGECCGGCFCLCVTINADLSYLQHHEQHCRRPCSRDQSHCGQFYSNHAGPSQQHPSMCSLPHWQMISRHAACGWSGSRVFQTNLCEWSDEPFCFYLESIKKMSFNEAYFTRIFMKRGYPGYPSRETVTLERDSYMFHLWYGWVP